MDDIFSGMLCFPENICSSNSQVSSHVSAHPTALQYKKYSVFLFHEKICYFFLWMLSVSLKHFGILVDVLVLHSTILLLAPHYHVIIVKLNRITATNI